MSNIDEKAKNNFTIEMRIFENYEKVKHEIIKVIDFLRHAETAMGMCRIFDNHEFWYRVIKQPERFGITHLWFPSGLVMERIKEEYDKDSEKRILRCSEGKSIWYQIWIDPGDMMRIEPLLEGGDRLWCIDYVFFYEVRNGRRDIEYSFVV